MKLYGYAYDTLWEISSITFTPTLFSEDFHVTIQMTDYFTSKAHEITILSKNHEDVFNKFESLSYFKDKFPEIFI